MAMFWIAVLAISILLYVLLDGFDLGVGMLFGAARGEPQRHDMISAVAPIWDGNETWLVVSGVILWGAFPIVYSTLMSAFYLPVLLMLAGLILRGVAFEFRRKTERMRWIWNASFAGGSLVAAFMQGLMVGALVEGLPLADGHYVGGEFGWLSPFAVLCGIGLCVGCSERAGWSGNVKARSATKPIASSPICHLRCSCSWSSCSRTPWPKICRS
jgi:cytochrome bd ubiquinol oxidase subunit II